MNLKSNQYLNYTLTDLAARLASVQGEIMKHLAL